MADPILQFKFTASKDIDVQLRSSEKCSKHPYGLEFAGHGETDDNGQWSIDLGAIACVKPGPGGDQRASFVATPYQVLPPRGGLAFRLHPPSVLDVIFESQSANRVQVRSFDLAGKAAPHVQFSWIAVVPGTLVTKKK